MFEIIPGTFREGALQLVQNVKYTIILLGVKVTVAIPRLLDPRVPEARRDGLDIDVGVNQQAGVAVPKIVNPDIRQPGSLRSLPTCVIQRGVRNYIRTAADTPII